MISRVRNRGFSMIEVLVTLVLISIGVLGMVAMQAKGITYTQDSVVRNQAALLADELMEILRSDRQTILDVKGVPSSASDYYKKKGTAFPDAPASCNPLPASAEDRLGCWAAKAAQTLPDASALLTSDFYVCRTDGSAVCPDKGAAIEIQLAWRVKENECMDANAKAGDDLTICHYHLRAEL
ncbi:type IV pilus modification protein PilV [Pseudomonas sp. J237]|nr:MULTISPECIES: type IV pilus modification protein PilV [Pseudomonas]OEO27169.1 type IV pilus modification protein PilV [Pseudomonas sp. J237]